LNQVGALGEFVLVSDAELQRLRNEQGEVIVAKCPYCGQEVESWVKHFAPSLPPSCRIEGSFVIHENCDGIHCSLQRQGR
jgi:hypothetical protein